MVLFILKISIFSNPYERFKKTDHLVNILAFYVQPESLLQRKQRVAPKMIQSSPC